MGFAVGERHRPTRLDCAAKRLVSELHVVEYRVALEMHWRMPMAHEHSTGEGFLAWRWRMRMMMSSSAKDARRPLR